MANMSPWKKWARATFRVFLLVGLLTGAMATIIGAFQDASGGSGLWALLPSQLMNIGLALAAFFGAIIVIRHEYLMHEMDSLYGNEHARKLLADGIPPYRDMYFQFVRDGNYAIANRFWQAGFVNIKDSYGRSDLHIACENGHAAIADGIIRHGGDPKQTNDRGLTPLMLAAVKGSKQVADVLLNHSPAINAKSVHAGASALFIAATNGKLNLVEDFIRSGAEIDSFDHSNRTPLLGALAQRKWDVAEFLLNAGANIMRRDSEGATAIDHAVAFNAPPELIDKIRLRGGVPSDPPFVTTGGAFSPVGDLRINWKRGDDDDL